MQNYLKVAIIFIWSLAAIWNKANAKRDTTSANIVLKYFGTESKKTFGDMSDQISIYFGFIKGKLSFKLKDVRLSDIPI